VPLSKYINREVNEFARSATILCALGSLLSAARQYKAIAYDALDEYLTSTDCVPVAMLFIATLGNNKGYQ